MKALKKLTDMKAIKAYSDPFKMIILKTYFKLGRPATVKQIADDMGEVPAKVHYHVKKLVEAEILKLDHTKEINGILAKFYLPTAQRFEVHHEKFNPEDAIRLDTHASHHNVLDVFDEHRNTVLETIDKASNHDHFVLSGELYLTQDEYQEMVEMLEKYHMSNKRKNSKKKCYKILTSVAQTS